jgi:alkanesulfonate monooxygenase SsuD/methylene tetrahydromethanopterin reductase-like flavin-dependent oxidoreductase (luciferase family)
VKFAVNIPNFGAFADANRLAELAKEAEDCGWDGFFLWDHVNHVWGDLPMIDPWIALSTMAVATERIRIGTMITPLARRRPWKLARETVTLDHLSGGRLTLGVGLGAPPETEFARLGEDPSARVRAQKLDEGLDVLQGLWSGEPFSYQGKYYQIDAVTFLPKPVQQPRIPIWIAAVWPNKPPFRRAARYNGVFATKTTTGDDFVLLDLPDFAQAHAYTEQERDDRTRPYDYVTGVALPDDRSKARDVVAEFEAAGLTWISELMGDPDSLSAKLRAGPPA